MKYIKVITNWLALIFGFPFILLIMLLIQPLIYGAVEFGKAWKEQFDSVCYLFQRTDFIKNRSPWLIEGKLWPLQRETPKDRAARRSARYAAKGHPNANLRRADHVHSVPTAVQDKK